MAKKSKAEFVTDVEKFTKRSISLEKQILAHLADGKEYADEAMERGDFPLFNKIMYFLYHSGPKAANSLCNAKSFFKEPVV